MKALFNKCYFSLIKSLIFILASSTTLQAQMAWKFISPDPYIPPIQEMQYVSGKIMARCEGNKLLETTDLLTTFSITSINFPDPDPNITSFSFLNDQTGIFVGSFGGEFIYRTTDKGNSCTRVYLNVGATNGLNDVAFKSTIGYAVGNKGRILKSTDGGVTWNLQNSTTDKGIEEIELFDQDQGIAITNTKRILRTLDGGATWIKDSTSIPTPCSNLSIGGANIAYIQSSSYLYKTTDAGATWSLIYTFSGLDPEDIQFTSVDTGYAFSPFYIYKTTDGGISWQETDKQDINYMYFLNSSTGFFTGSIIYRTQDAGSSYQQLTKRITAENLNTVSFPTADIGYMGGNMGTLLKSTNRGANWEVLPFPSPATDEIAVIKFKTENIGFGITHGFDQNFQFQSTIYKTIDGGINWSSVKICINKALKDIDVLSNDQAIAVGYDNNTLQPYISYTTDGGLSWNEGNTTIDKILNAVSMFNESYGFIAADNNVLKTIDGGQTWTSTTFAEPIRDIQVIDSLTSYAAGNKVYKSIDGGLSYQPVFSPSFVALMDIQFPDPKFGYASGLDVSSSTWQFYRTADSGLTWNVVALPYEKQLNDIFFTAPDKGFIIGEEGDILTSDTGLTIFSPWIEIRSLSVYPNPSSGLFYINTDCLENLRLYRLGDGALIKNYRIEGQKIQIPNKGIYLISVQCKGKQYIQKLIVE